LSDTHHNIPEEQRPQVKYSLPRRLDRPKASLDVMPKTKVKKGYIYMYIVKEWSL